MKETNCIVSNIILGCALMLVSIVPLVVTFTISTFTYACIIAFDIIAIGLTFVLDFNYAKVNRFGIPEMQKYVVLPLVIPSIVFALVYFLFKIVLQ